MPRIKYPNGKPCQCGCGQPAAKNINSAGVDKGWLRYAKGHAPRGAPEEARKRGMETIRKNQKERYPIGSRRQTTKREGLCYWEIKISHEGRWVLEHRWIMEQQLDRALAPGEVVHHKDGDGLNNDPANLELMTAKSHMEMHSKDVRPTCNCTCPNCGASVTHFKLGEKRKYPQTGL